MANKKVTKSQVKDAVPEIKNIMPDTKAPALIGPIRNPVLVYGQTRTSGRGSFASSEYNLAEIGRIEDTESYVRQAFSKKVALMFKEGFDLVSRNQKSIKYIKIRLAQIAQASSIPTTQLFRDIGSGLIKKSNVLLVKNRNVEASGGKVRTLPGTDTELKPIAGYFVAPAETMEYSMAGNKIVKWKQSMPDGQVKEFSPNDVVHMFYDRKEGFVFGTPTLVPVVDDIRALRKIEENIELLVYQHLFPLFQWVVGTETSPATIDENGEREVDVTKREIQYLPSEGGIVTTERHEIRAIGAEGRALKADGYLTHFKNRVISGLGISAVDLGEGNTANRATADNMSRNLVDSVKDFQQVMEFFVTEFIFKELLLESTFGPEVLDEENRVWLKFKEIDIDAQIKKESHMADQFNKNFVTWDEARMRVGLEPVKVPEPEEIVEGSENLDQKYPEWFKSFWKLFKEPELLITATKGGTLNAAAMAAAKSPLTAIEPGDVDEAHNKAMEQEKEMEKIKGEAKVESAKALAKAKPKPKVKDAVLTSTFRELKTDILEYVSEAEQIDNEWVGQIIRASMAPSVEKLQTLSISSFRNGYAKHGSTRTETYINSVRRARIQLNSRVEKYVNRLINDMVSSFKRNIKKSMSKTEVNITTHSVFDALKFRTDFIEDVELRKAYALGAIVALRDSGVERLYISSNEECPTCSASDSVIKTSVVHVEDVPPFHANCHCSFSKTPPPDFKDSLQDDNVKDAAKLENCVLKLRKRHPDWSEEKIRGSAFAIYNSRMK